MSQMSLRLRLMRPSSACTACQSSCSVRRAGLCLYEQDGKDGEDDEMTTASYLPIYEEEKLKRSLKAVSEQFWSIVWVACSRRCCVPFCPGSPAGWCCGA